MQGSSLPAGDLGRLIDTEHVLEERMAAAREDARQMVESARRRAAENERQMEREIADAQAGAAAFIERERASRARQLLDQANRDAARYRDIGPTRMESLVSRVLHLVVAP